MGLNEMWREIRNGEDIPEEPGASKTNVYLLAMLQQTSQLKEFTLKSYYVSDVITASLFTKCVSMWAYAKAAEIKCYPLLQTYTYRSAIKT